MVKKVLKVDQAKKNKVVRYHLNKIVKILDQTYNIIAKVKLFQLFHQPLQIDKCITNMNKILAVERMYHNDSELQRKTFQISG